MQRVHSLEAILKFITDYIARHGYSPSLRDISGAFKSSTSVMRRNVQILAEQGKIEVDERKARSIRVVTK